MWPSKPELKRNTKGRKMEHIEKTIEELKGKVIEKEKELNEAKKMANTLCQMFGRPPLYEINDQPTTVLTGQLHGDEYYGQAFATVVTNILGARKMQVQGQLRSKRFTTK